MPDNVINSYNKRAMMDMAEELLPPQTFLMKTWTNHTETFASREVDMDIRKGKRKMSAYVRRADQGNFVDKIGFSTKTFTPPYLKPKIPITPGDLQKRTPQEGIYDNTGNLQPQIEDFIAQQIDDLDLNQIVRNEEWQVRQGLFEGKVIAYDNEKKVLAEINFGRDASLTYTVSPTWDNASSDPIETGADARRRIQKLSGFSARVALMAPDVVPKFMNNTQVKGQLNKDFSARGNLAFDIRDDGGIWLGSDGAYDYWTYEEWIVDPADGVEKLVIPSKTVLYGAPQARYTRLYGAVEATVDGKIVIEAAQRLITMRTEDDPAALIVQVHSAPLMVPSHPDAYAVVTVLP